MQVVLRVSGRIEVHDEADAIDVDSACGYVRRDQGRHLPVLEPVQRLGSRGLCLPSVKGSAGHSLLS